MVPYRGGKKKYAHLLLPERMELTTVRFTSEGCFFQKASPSGKYFKTDTLAIVGGWTGSKRKHVKKYCDLLNSYGIHTIGLTIGTRYILGFQRYGRHLAEDILSLLEETEFFQFNILFMSFSNGGCFIYRCITELLEVNNQRYEGVRNRLKAAVFDSCPSDLTYESGGKALFNGTK